MTTTENPEREQAIATAISERRIHPARADHYREAWAKSPEATAALLQRLEPFPAELYAGGKDPATAVAEEEKVRGSLGL